MKEYERVKDFCLGSLEIYQVAIGRSGFPEPSPPPHHLCVADCVLQNDMATLLYPLFVHSFFFFIKAVCAHPGCSSPRALCQPGWVVCLVSVFSAAEFHPCMLSVAETTSCSARVLARARTGV